MKPEIYIVKNEKSIDEVTFHFLMKYVQPEKAHRILRQRIKQNADNMLIGDILAKYMISKKLGISFLEQKFCYGIYGKPYLLDYSGIYFSISHSGQFVACAVCDQPVGLDIQMVFPYKFSIANRVCNINEITMIRESMDQSKKFTEIWTRKEAYLKMIGIGLGENIRYINYPEDTLIQTNEYEKLIISVSIHLPKI